MLQIHKASAGSGKTFTLTREYIKLLLGRKVHLKSGGTRYALRHSVNYGFGKPKAQGSILAVTFTNKATEEMTSRIIKELGTLADNDPASPSPYLDYFRRLFRTDDRTLARHARRALNDLLFNFSTFNVSTLDSFFQNVLRTFARELDLSGDFSLEIDDSYPVKVAVANMLESVNTPVTRVPGQSDEDFRRASRRHRFLSLWLEKYLNALNEKGKSILLFARSSSSHRDLVKTVGNLLGESYRINREVIDGYLADPSRIERFQAELAKARERLADRARQSAATLLALVEAKDLNANVAKVMAGMAEKPYVPGSYASVTKAAGASGAVKERYKAAFCKQVTPTVDAALDTALDAALAYIANAPLYEFLSRNIYILGLFSGVSEQLERYCEENDAFILSDTNDFLRDLIREEDAPFIYERLGTRLAHFLIDEFQDTSEMQWANMKPLVLESLSRGEDNLIIGDEKQSIYRFRNSSPDILGSGVQAAVVPRFGEDAVDVRGERIEENTNWRSAPAVVMFNNSLFGPLARLLDDRVAPEVRPFLSLAATSYSGLVQSVAGKNIGLPGMVRVYFAPLLPPKKEMEQLPEEEADRLPAPRDPEWVLEKLCREIERQLAAGFRPSDIAVLVRSRAYGKKVIMRLLKRMEEPGWEFGKIPVVSADALRVDSSLAVQLIIGVLRLAITPEYVLDDSSRDKDGEPRRVRNAAYRRARMIHRYNLCLFDQVQATDENGQPVFNDDGSPLMRRLTHSEALEKAVNATAEPAHGQEPEPLQAAIDAQALNIKVMDCPSIDALVERVIRLMLPPDCRREELPYISAFMDLVLDFQERGITSIQEFLQWWDSAGKYATLDSPSGLEAITVTTIHKSKGLEYACVHVPFCWERIVKFDGHDWYTLDPAFLPGIDPEIIPPFIPVANQSVQKIEAFSKEISRYAHEQRVDALNVTYVAFTRARYELCVYSDPNVEAERIGPALREAAGLCTDEYIDSASISDDNRRWLIPLAGNITKQPDGFELLQIGEPVDKASLDTGRQSERISAAGKNAPATDPGETTRENDIRRFLSEGYTVHDRQEFTITSDFDELTGFDFDQERHRGIFLHSVLSRVRRAADLDRALDRAAHRYRLDETRKALSREILSNALADPRVAPWFDKSAKVITERPITTPRAIRRPDRIVWLPDGTIAVIDYKFGTHERPSYFEQVRDYSSFLSSTLGKPVKGYLWFPLTSRIIPVN